MGFVERVSDPATGSVDYLRTEAAIALEPALNALAHWAQCSLDAETAMCTASVSNLMWKMRNQFDTDAFPPHRRLVIQFRFADEGLDYDTYWALIQPDATVEICTSIPGYDIDLFVETNATSLLGIILGRTNIARELELGELFLSGDAVLARTMSRWFKPGEYAELDRIQMLPNRRKWTRGQTMAAPGQRRAAIV
jgi:hypothetical protein